MVRTRDSTQSLQAAASTPTRSTTPVEGGPGPGSSRPRARSSDSARAGRLSTTSATRAGIQTGSREGSPEDEGDAGRLSKKASATSLPASTKSSATLLVVYNP